MTSSKQNFFVIIFAFVLIGLFTVRAQATAPANDNFQNAELLSGLSGTVFGNNVSATKQAGEPAHAWNPGGHSVWYKYIAPGNGVMTVQTGGSDIDTLLAVYQGPNFASLHLTAANDNFVIAQGAGTSSRVVFGTQTGLTYYLAVDGRAGASVETGLIQLFYQFTNAPENDSFNLPQFYYDLATGPETNFVSGTDVGASRETGEPNHVNNPGGRSVWYHLKLASVSRSMNFTLESKLLTDPGIGTSMMLAIYRGSSLGTLTPVTGALTTANQPARLVVQIQAGQDYYLAVDGYDAGSGALLGNFTLGYGSTKTRRNPDFDHDGVTDISVYRPSTGYWYSLDSGSGEFRANQWGANGDKPLFNHWDNDEKPDYAVYRPDTQVWHLSRSFGPFYQAFAWGTDSDIPLTLNQYGNTSPTLGDRINCFATVFRPSNGTWYIHGASQNTTFQFGQSGDIPMTADFDGDGTDEIAVFRPSNGTWYVANAFTGALFTIQQFGQNGDKPVPADFDGDGRTDIAVFRPSNGTWYILGSQTGQLRVVQFGLSADKPQPSDYSGDGLDDIAVFRPSTGTWYILRSFTNTLQVVQFGQNGDVPMSAAVQ